MALSMNFEEYVRAQISKYDAHIALFHIELGETLCCARLQDEWKNLLELLTTEHVDTDVYIEFIDFCLKDFVRFNPIDSMTVLNCDEWDENIRAHFGDHCVEFDWIIEHYQNDTPFHNFLRKRDTNVMFVP